MSGKCHEHYPAEMDEAINAGACPICQSAEIDRLRRELAENEELYNDLNNDYVLVRNSREDLARELAEAWELLGEALSSLEDLYHGGDMLDCRHCELYRRICDFRERKP